MPRPSVIAIDGPVASGKTAVGRLLSQRLSYRFLDTGSMYRAITWVALHRGVDIGDEGMLGKLAREITIQVKEQDLGAVIVEGQDITAKLQLPEVAEQVSRVSQVLEVRCALVEQQQVIAYGGKIVMVGRDIGTVVLPDAELKLFLKAPTAERARRRHLEMVERGEKVDHQQVLGEIEERDRLDTERVHSPLKPASDALIMETQGLNVEQVVDSILKHMEGH